jgi:hypothetical protein
MDLPVNHRQELHGWVGSWTYRQDGIQDQAAAQAEPRGKKPVVQCLEPQE